MSRKRELAQSAAMISIFTLVSKALGFIREVKMCIRDSNRIDFFKYFLR